MSNTLESAWDAIIGSWERPGSPHYPKRLLLSDPNIKYVAMLLQDAIKRGVTPSMENWKQIIAAATAEGRLEYANSTQQEAADSMPHPDEPALKGVTSFEIATRRDLVSKIMQVYDGGVLLQKFNDRLQWLKRNTVSKSEAATQTQATMPLLPKTQNKELNSDARQLVDDLATLEKYSLKIKPTDFRNVSSGRGATTQYRNAVSSLSAWIGRMEARNIAPTTIKEVVGKKLDELTSTSVR